MLEMSMIWLFFSKPPHADSAVSKLQFFELSTVGCSFVSKQEAHICDLENKLEFQNVECGELGDEKLRRGEQNSSSRHMELVKSA